MSAEEKDSTNEPRRKRRLAPALIPPLLLLASVGIWFWASHGSESAQAHDLNPVQSTLHLETFVLNLADTDQRSYLRVGIDIGLNQEACWQRKPQTMPFVIAAGRRT